MTNDLDDRIAKMEQALIKASLEPTHEELKKLVKAAGAMPPRDVQLIEAAVTGIAPVVFGQIAAAVLPIARAVKELKSQMSAVLDRGIMYRGVYQPAQDYQRGDAITCEGGLWISLRKNAGIRPGSDVPSGESPAWQLAVKSAGSISSAKPPK